MSGESGVSWLQRATDVLAASGVPSPRVDAELLAVEGLGMSRPLDLGRDPGRPYWDLVTRRAEREPLQHVLGQAWFRHLCVAVGPGVFVPRPETEVVAQAAIDEAAAVASQGRTPVVVDLGTGSGVIALSLAAEVPAAVVHAVEMDEDAWVWARHNCTGSRVVLHHGDLRECLPHLDGLVDVVVSNPPYIPSDAVPRDEEVWRHDPAPALYGSDADGLGEARAVVATAARLLAEAGLLVVEHAESQADAVTDIMAGGWADRATHRDLAGRPRFTTARRARA